MKEFYQLKIRPHVYFESFLIQLKQPDQEPVKKIVEAQNLNTMPTIIVTMLSHIANKCSDYRG